MRDRVQWGWKNVKPSSFLLENPAGKGKPFSGRGKKGDSAREVSKKGGKRGKGGAYRKESSSENERFSSGTGKMGDERAMKSEFWDGGARSCPLGEPGKPGTC